jgi:hypothetical protein
MAGPTPPQRPQWANEKEQEKHEEKQDEKRPQEKHWEEKYRRDPLSSIIWPAIFIWAGLSLLAANLGLLPPNLLIPGWGLAFTGAGLILLLEVLIRLALPTYRRPVIGTTILAVIFLGIGLQGVMRWELLWPLALILIGLAILLRNAGRSA